MSRTKAPYWPGSDWMKLAHDGWWLWAESLAVMGLRTTDMMTGRGSGRENALMVSEKVQAGAELAAKLATAGLVAPERSAQLALNHYRRKVRANRKRLTRS